MIDILTTKSIFETAIAAINADKKVINHLIISPTESHAVKRLADKPGLNLVVKLPDTESDIESEDHYSEAGKMIVFLLEKHNQGNFTEDEEIQRYAEIQATMRTLKEWFTSSGKDLYTAKWKVNGKMRTEWEFQTFGGHDGLSVSFTITDYQL